MRSCHGVWAGTLVPPTSMDSANHTRLWVGLGLQWGPGTTTPKGATPLQPFLFLFFLLTLQFYVIAITSTQALPCVLFGCRDNCKVKIRSPIPKRTRKTYARARDYKRLNANYKLQ